MAIGDRIGSAQTAGFMRRINALENEVSYAVGSDSSLLPDTQQQIGCDMSANVYTGGGTASKGLNKTPYDLSSLTEIVTYGSDSDQVGIITSIGGSADGIWVGNLYDESGYGLKDARIQKFDTSGSLQETITKLATSSTAYWSFNNIEVFPDGSIMVTRAKTTGAGFTDRDIITYDSDGSNPTTILSYTSGLDPAIMSSNIYEVYSVEQSTGECTVYDISGTYIRDFNIGSITAGSIFTFVNPSRFMVNDFSSPIDAVDFYTDNGVLLTSDVEITDAPHGGQMYHSVINEIGDIYTAHRHSGSYYIGDASGISTSPQTTWYQYPTPSTDTGKVSLGTVDYGVTVPTDTALQGFRPHYFELRDMRDAIESVSTDYENPATNNAYTLTAGADNIFRVAIDSGQDDWTTPTVTHADRIREDYYNDIELVLTQLESSSLV